MKFFLFVLTFLATTLIQAQVQREDPPSANNPQIQLRTHSIAGKIVDPKTSKGLEAVTVQLFILSTLSDQTVKDSMIAGMFTRNNGDFVFQNLPDADSFRLVVSGIGYKDIQKTIVFRPQGDETQVLDIGNLALEQDAKVMSNIIITAQRPALEMGIDRKIFSVERSLTATGGTALDVMRNIPSVSVDVEGNVQLRNAQPQIFVDGRPTVLTLDQIPADQVERVELITNPSAKFDAASSAGIINVVMKRNRRIGLNGVVSAGGGHPDILNGNLTLNARQGKFNVFASGAYNRSGGRAQGKTLRQNKNNGVLSNYFNQYSWNESQRRFTSLRFGLDFFATNRSTISLTQNIVGGNFENDEEQDQEYLNPGMELERYGKRNATGAYEFDRYNTQFNYSLKFAEPGKELSTNINYNYGNGKQASNMVNSFFNPDGTAYSNDARVRNQGSNNNDQLTFQIDFEDPKGDDSKLETGFRTFINKQKSYFSSFSVNNGTEILLPLSNNYAYTEKINALYFTYSNKINTWSYQAGLRAEHSRFEGELIDSARKFGYEYPNSGKRFFDALFPSLFITKQASDNIELQVNYTRRIRRPNFWQLNPFIDINDPVNLRQGNPLLQPEFTNSFEFNYNQKYDGGSFLGVIYYRNNLRDITRYSDTVSTTQYQQLNNAAIDPNAILNTFINARSTNRLGAEFTLQHKIGDNFDFTPNFNLQYRKVNADIGNLNLSNEGFNWEGKLTANYKVVSERSKFMNDFAFQLMGEYESEEVTAQGRNVPQYRVDFALRKEFLNEKKATITFSINDLFNTHRYGNIYDTENFYQEGYSRRNVRSFRINFTYKFGKNDFSLFKKEDRQDNDDD